MARSGSVDEGQKEGHSGYQRGAGSANRDIIVTGIHCTRAQKGSFFMTGRWNEQLFSRAAHSRPGTLKNLLI